jgi:multidrug efflux pump subunit AcrB
MLLSGCGRSLRSSIFERGFDRFRSAYRGLLGTILNRRGSSLCLPRFLRGSWVLVPFLGQDFFPAVDAGTFRLHVRAATGTRVEETANLVDQVEASDKTPDPGERTSGDCRQHRPARIGHKSLLQR